MEKLESLYELFFKIRKLLEKTEKTVEISKKQLEVLNEMDTEMIISYSGEMLENDSPYTEFTPIETSSKPYPTEDLIRYSKLYKFCADNCTKSREESDSLLDLDL